MLGFPQALKNLGGVVRGKGTETSDSNHGEIAEGSYVMPADSTRQIGAQNMAAMGLGKWAGRAAKDVPVALSNGEYVMPPEQVHAVGAQALNALKDATHQPVARGLTKPDAKRAFLADGGLAQVPLPAYASVDEVRRDLQRMKAASRAQMAANGALPESMPLPASMPAPGDGIRTFGSVQDARNEIGRMQAASRADMARIGALPPSVAQTAQPAIAQAPGLGLYKSADDARNAIAGMRAASGVHRDPNRPARQYLADGGLATDDELQRKSMTGTRPAASTPYDNLSLGQPEPNPDSGAAWRALKRAFLYNSDVDAAEKRRADANATHQPSAAAAAPANQGVFAGQWGGSSWIKRTAAQPSFSAAAGASRSGFSDAGAQQPASAQSAQTAGVANADGTIRFDRATNTYSGTNIGPNASIEGGRNLGGIVSNGVSSGAASAQRVADIYKSMAYGDGPRSVSAPTVRHSGNDWAARQALRNAQVGASTLRGEWDLYRDGQIDSRGRPTRQAGQPSAAQQQYAAMLASDQAARVADGNMQQEGLRQQGALSQAQLREAGADRRAALSEATDRMRVGLAERQQQEAERNGVIERGVAELGLNQAMRLERAQRDYESASTQEARDKARQRLLALQGKQDGGDWVVHVTPSIKNADGSTSEGSVIRHNKQTGQVERVNVAAPLPPMFENPQAIAIKNNSKLSTEQKAAELSKLGYADD